MPRPLRVKHEKEAILVWGAERLSVHSAKDGEMHWVSTGFNPKQKKNWVVVGSQVVVGDIAIVPYGRGTHMKGIRMGGKGDIALNPIYFGHVHGHQICLFESSGGKG